MSQLTTSPIAWPIEAEREIRLACRVFYGCTMPVPYRPSHIPGAVVVFDGSAIRVFYAGYSSGKSATSPVEAYLAVTEALDDLLRAAATPPKSRNVERSKQERKLEEQREISLQQARRRQHEKEFALQSVRSNLLTAPGDKKDDIARTLTREQAQSIIEYLDAAPGDDPNARSAIARVYPDLHAMIDA